MRSERFLKVETPLKPLFQPGAEASALKVKQPESHFGRVFKLTSLPRSALPSASSDAPPIAASAKAAAVANVGRAPSQLLEPKIPHLRVDFSDSNNFEHSIRYDHKDNAFVAYCGKHRAAACTLTRQANAGRKAGSGRPLGLMFWWLSACGRDEHDTSTKAPHRGLRKPSQAERLAARAELANLANGPVLMAFEAAIPEGDCPEPSTVP